MKIGFFLRCGKKEGLGHLYRSLQILEYMQKHMQKKASLSPYFFLSPYRLARRILKEKGFPAFSLDKYPSSLKLDLAIVDRLSTSQAFARKIRSHARRQVHFDDFGKGSREADLLIQGLLGGWKSRVIQENGKTCYAGPSYLFLAPTFMQRQRRKIVKDVKNIYLNFGGSDAKNLAKRYLPTLSKLPFAFHLVSPYRFHYPNVDCYTDIPSSTIASLLQKCDIGITTLGISFFEALSQGLPTLTLAVNAHQLRRGRESSARGLTLYMGKAPLASSTVEKYLNTLSASLSLRKSLSRAGLKTIDGKGAERISQILLSLCQDLC